MHHGVYLIFGTAAGFGILTALVAQESTLPGWLTLFLPMLTILVGYILTRRNLKRQDAKVQEIHVLVNSQLSQTLAALANALTENIALKMAAGVAVTPQEIEMAANPTLAAKKEEVP